MMLKKRIVSTLIVKNNIVVQSRGFTRYLPVGNIQTAMEFLDSWGIDEIILLDIDATRERREPNYQMVRNSSRFCRVPLTVGGGITCIEHISNLMLCGVDKISINQIALYNPSFLSQAAKLFGSQCLVVSIDALYVNSKHYVYDYLQRKVLSVSITEFAKKLQEYGAGEIFINSVDRDGIRCGYDLQLINDVCASVTIPIICCGGAGKPQHLIDVLRSTSVNAVAAGNFFHFSEHSVTKTKAIISKSGIPVRHETHALYNDNRFDSDGRLLKKEESELEELLYHRITKEVI